MDHAIDLQDIAGWIAPIATTIAAIMTAANLGTRITGWGFAVFTLGSLSWSAVAIGTGQSNLLWTNGFLTLVNVIGIWRWLGRQARHEDGREDARRRSAAQSVPSLFGLTAVLGAPLIGRGGTTLGVVVDGMMRCADTGLAYIVVGEGGVAGVGERLHAIDPRHVRFTSTGLVCDLTAADLQAMPTLAGENWPVEIGSERLASAP